MASGSCLVASCNEPVKTKGYCRYHYNRSWRGFPLDLPYGCMRYTKLWKEIKYVTAHKRCTDMWGPAKLYPCVSCSHTAREWAYDGMDTSDLYGPAVHGGSKVRYSRFPEFYKPMCAKCHRRDDKYLAAQELEEYREWKRRTGLTLKDIPPIGIGFANY